jgi:hypothetical protein
MCVRFFDFKNKKYNAKNYSKKLRNSQFKEVKNG